MKLEEILSGMERSQRQLVSDRHRTLTGCEFVRAVREVSIALTGMGVGGHKTCMLRMANSLDCVITLFALLLCDSVVFLANPHDPIRKVSRTIDRFSLFALLADKPSSQAVGKRRGNRTSDQSRTLSGVSICVSIFAKNNLPLSAVDPCMEEANIAIFSSGSTGEPKAILHKFESLWLNAKMHAESIGVKASDRIGVILPLYYSYGLVANLLAGFVTEAYVNLYAQNGIVDAEWLQNNKITVLSVTPYFTKALTSPLTSLRVMTVGGDVLHKNQALGLMYRFPDCELFATYGLTEAGPRVATWRFDQTVFETSRSAPIGSPLKGVALSVRKDRNDKHSYAELVVQTPTCMVGYYYGSTQGFAPVTSAEKYIHTEDLVEVRNGDYFLVGRKKGLIAQGGEKLFPAATENAIQEIEGVTDVRVEGIIDEQKRRVARAIIVAENGITTALVRKKLLQSFPRSQVPERIEFVSSIPRTAIGKAVSGTLTRLSTKTGGGLLNKIEPSCRRIQYKRNKSFKEEPNMASSIDKNSLLVGAWELESYAVEQPSGEALDLWGDDTTGLLIYMSSGYMSVHVSNKNRPKFRGNDILSGTVEEIRAAFEGFITYFGTYNYDPEIGVVHHKIAESLFPNWSGVTQQRFTSLDGDALVLTTPEITINNAEYVMTLKWKKLKEREMVMSGAKGGSHHGQQLA